MRAFCIPPTEYIPMIPITAKPHQFSFILPTADIQSILCACNAVETSTYRTPVLTDLLIWLSHGMMKYGDGGILNDATHCHLVTHERAQYTQPIAMTHRPSDIQTALVQLITAHCVGMPPFALAVGCNLHTNHELDVLSRPTEFTGVSASKRSYRLHRVGGAS